MRQERKAAAAAAAAAGDSTGNDDDTTGAQRLGLRRDLDDDESKNALWGRGQNEDVSPYCTGSPAKSGSVNGVRTALAPTIPSLGASEGASIDGEAAEGSNSRKGGCGEGVDGRLGMDQREEKHW